MTKSRAELRQEAGLSLLIARRGETIAREVGGTFKVFGRRAILVKRNGGMSVSGAVLSAVTAQWGVNLINWDIAPVVGRPRYVKVRARWYDVKDAKWKEENVEVDDSTAQQDNAAAFDESESAAIAVFSLPTVAA